MGKATPIIDWTDEIARQSEPYCIAEIGCNHNGDSGKAVDMIWGAKEAGCQAVKLQYYLAEHLMPWVPNKVDLAKCELTDAGWQTVAETAAEAEIDWFASAFCEHALKELIQLKPCRWKSSAPDLTKASEWAKITQLDWWASYDPRFARHDELYTKETAVEAKVLFRCVSDYPAFLSQYHSDVLFKYNAISDHTVGLEFVNYAGESFDYWEKHFKLDDDYVDAEVSLNVSQMKRYVETIHERRGDYKLEDIRLKRMLGRFE